MEQRFTRPGILFAFVHTPSILCSLGFRSFDAMIPRSFCSFSSFSGVLFRLYVKLVFTNQINYSGRSGLLINDITDHLPIFALCNYEIEHNKCDTVTYLRNLKNGKFESINME